MRYFLRAVLLCDYGRHDDVGVLDGAHGLRA